MNRFRCSHCIPLIAVLLLIAPGVDAQTGGSGITLKGGIAKTVALSILPHSSHSDANFTTFTSGNSVGLTLSGAAAESPVIRVPLIVRSNTGFRISVVFEANTARLTELSVIDVRATGTSVSPLAISELEIPRQFDLRGPGETGSAPSFTRLDASQPLLVLSGPRVSLGGTLDSPTNGLQITLLFRMKLQAGQSQPVHLTFVGTTIDTL